MGEQLVGGKIAGETVEDIGVLVVGVCDLALPFGTKEALRQFAAVISSVDSGVQSAENGN